MNPLIAFLQTCTRDARLPCFWALVVLGPVPVSQDAVAAFLNVNIKTVAGGLRGLKSLALATCTGTRHLTNWTLSATGLMLAHLFREALANLPQDMGYQNALPLAPAAAQAGEAPISAKRISEAEAEPISAKRRLELVDSTISAKRISEVVESESVKYINSNSTSSSGPEILRGEFATILKAGGVYANTAKALLSKLEAQPEYLAHLLAHLAYVKSGRAQEEQGYKFGGVYLRDCIESLTRVTDSELPPADLDFEAALRWAMNGGQTDEQVAQRQAEEATRAAEQEAYAKRLAAVQAIEAEAEPSAPPEPPSENAIFWQTILDQLKMEMAKLTFETWARETTLVTREGNTFVIGAPNAYAKDWLENRLTSSVRRALASATGQNGSDIQVNFIVWKKATNDSITH